MKINKACEGENANQQKLHFATNEETAAGSLVAVISFVFSGNDDAMFQGIIANEPLFQLWINHRPQIGWRFSPC